MSFYSSLKVFFYIHVVNRNISSSLCLLVSFAVDVNMHTFLMLFSIEYNTAMNELAICHLKTSAFELFIV